MPDTRNLDRSACPIRKDNVIEVAADEDLLLYDDLSHRAYCLKSEMAVIWHQCDGTTSVDQMIGTDDGAKRDTLVQLRDDGLITGLPSMEQRRGMSRRSLVTVSGAVAAGAVFAPMLEGIIVPHAAAAASAFPQNPGNGGLGGDGGLGGGDGLGGEGGLGGKGGLGKGRHSTGGKGGSNGKGKGRHSTGGKSGLGGKGGLGKGRHSTGGKGGSESKGSLVRRRRGTGPHGSNS